MSASMVLIERAAFSILASTSSSFPLALVRNPNTVGERIAAIAIMNALRFIVDSLLGELRTSGSLQVDHITGLARTLFNPFDARNLNRVSILPFKSVCYLSFEIAGIDLSDLAASHDHRLRSYTVKCAARSKHNKRENQHTHYIILPGRSVVRPKQNLLQCA